MKQIMTRDDLVAQIVKIIESNVDAYGHIEDEIWTTAEEICDLIAGLENLKGI